MTRHSTGKARFSSKARQVHQTIIEAVKAEITRQQLTYYRIAKETGISPSALSRFAQPGGTLCTTNLLVLLDYLGIDLISRDGDVEPIQARVLYRAGGRQAQ